MPTAPDDLRALLPRGATVYTFTVSETRTGDGVRLLVLAVVAGEILPLSRSVAELLGWQPYGAQVVAQFPRAKAGPELTAHLSYKLHGTMSALHHQSLGEGR